MPKKNTNFNFPEPTK